MSAVVATVIAAALTVLPLTTAGQRSGSPTARPVLVPVANLLENASGGTLVGAMTGLSQKAEPGTSQTTGPGGAAKTAITDVSDITHSGDSASSPSLHTPISSISRRTRSPSSVASGFIGPPLPL